MPPFQVFFFDAVFLREKSREERIRKKDCVEVEGDRQVRRRKRRRRYIRT